MSNTPRGNPWKKNKKSPPEPKNISRRNFIGVISASSVLWAILVSALKQKPGVTFGTSCVWLRTAEKQEIARAVELYSAQYGLITPIVIELEDLSRETRILPDGQRLDTLEIASRWLITIDPLAPEKYKIVLHALSHANQKDGYEPEIELFTLEEVWSTKKPDRIYGYKWFRALVELPSGEKTGITVIEEWVCEALAWEVDNSYTWRAYEYAAFFSLVKKLMIRKNISAPALAQMIQNHELKKFIGILFDTDEPTQEQMVEVFEWFMSIKNGIPLEEVIGRAFQEVTEDARDLHDN